MNLFQRNTSENILAYISETRIFPNMEFVLEHSNINFYYIINSVKIKHKIFQ